MCETLSVSVFPPSWLTGAQQRRYFDFLLSLAGVFFVCALLGTPLTLACVAGETPYIQHLLARFAIGNLGQCGISNELCDTLRDQPPPC